MERHGFWTGGFRLTGIWTALLLTLALIVLPSTGIFAESFDPGTAVSLTVQPSGGGGTEAFTDDIDSAGIVIDLYKVADAQTGQGSDFEIVESETYQALFDEEGPNLNNNDLTNADWHELGQQAAGIALGRSLTPLVRGAAISTKISAADADGPGAGQPLSAGLYLVIARGSQISANEYIKTLDDGRIATIARSAEYEYTFEPELIALPTKEAVDGVISTMNPGDWIYDATIYLKAERENKKASLEIIKTLGTYETKDPATFVFQVDGVLGEQTYSNVFSVVFDEPGTKKISIDNLPVGMEMTVKEIYSGNNYKLTAGKTNPSPLKITAEQVAQAVFENDYDDTWHGGGSIENRFTYAQDGDQSGWQWYGIDDDGKRYEIKRK